MIGQPMGVTGISGGLSPKLKPSRAFASAFRNTGL